MLSDKLLLEIIEAKSRIIRHLYSHQGCLGDKCPQLSPKLVEDLRASMTGVDDQELGPAANAIPYAKEIQ